MTGLKICTRWRAISARFKRRISSSLFPENMGPTITSIQPMFPFTISTIHSLPAQNNILHCHYGGYPPRVKMKLISVSICGSRSSHPPQRRLLFLAVTFQQKSLQSIDIGKDAVGASQHPAAHLIEVGIRDQIHGNSAAVGKGQLGGSSSTS